MLRNPAQLLPYDYSLSTFLFDDFNGGTDNVNTTVNASFLSNAFTRISNAAAGAGATIGMLGVGNDHGVCRAQTGTTAGGGAGGGGQNVGTSLFSKGPTLCDMRACVLQLSTGVDRFEVSLGHAGILSTLNHVAFKYNDATSPNWTCFSSKAGVSISKDSGIVVAANTYYKLKITTDANYTTINYYINNLLVATVNTPANMPDGASLGFNIFKSIGLNACTLMLDYFGFQQIFNTAR